MRLVIVCCKTGNPTATHITCHSLTKLFIWVTWFATVVASLIYFFDKVETNSDAVFIGGYLPRIPARRTSGLSLRNTNPSGALAYILANVKSASILLRAFWVEVSKWVSKVICSCKRNHTWPFTLAHAVNSPDTKAILFSSTFHKLFGKSGSTTIFMYIFAPITASSTNR